MELAIAEPYFYLTHGGTNSIPHYMVVYSYSVDEFYNNVWQDEYKVSFRYIRRQAHRASHDIIRNYKYHLDKHVKMELVQIYEDSERHQLCILHTYKLNLFKRIWRKRRALRRQT
jgi:hypothetical protein